jgi:hypothetical protein
MAKFGRNARKRFGDEAQDIFGPESTDIRSAIDSLGGGDSGKRALAEQLSGTNDRNSRAYKTARDYISRHLRGARGAVKSEKYGNVLTTANREGRKREIMEGGSLTVRIEGDIKISDKVWKNGYLKATLTGSKLESYLSDIEAGRYSDAINIVEKEYGIGHTATLAKFRRIEYT